MLSEGRAVRHDIAFAVPTSRVCSSATLPLVLDALQKPSAKPDRPSAHWWYRDAESFLPGRRALLVTAVP